MRKLALFETHIINLIVPIQNISHVLTDRNVMEELKIISKSQIKIDDTSLRSIVSEFRHTAEKIEKDLNFVDISQTLSEIKYIGKRLNEIEIILDKIKEDGVNRKITFDVNVEGIKQEAKVIETEINKEEFQNLRNVLNGINEMEKLAIIHKHGLFGETVKRHSEIGKILKKSTQRAATIYRTGLMRLAMRCTKKQVMMVEHAKIRQLLMAYHQ